MKRNILKTLALTLLVVCFGKANAQSDLLAYNSVSSIAVPNEIAARFTAEEKVKIGDFNQDEASSGVRVSVSCLNPVNMKIKYFNMNGEMAKEESLNLNSGSNELNVSLNGLSKGIYMVQFYSKDGSAVRRLIKMD